MWPKRRISADTPSPVAGGLRFETWLAFYVCTVGADHRLFGATDCVFTRLTSCGVFPTVFVSANAVRYWTSRDTAPALVLAPRSE